MPDIIHIHLQRQKYCKIIFYNRFVLSICFVYQNTTRNFIYLHCYFGLAGRNVCSNISIKHSLILRNRTQTFILLCSIVCTYLTLGAPVQCWTEVPLKSIAGEYPSFVSVANDLENEHCRHYHLYRNNHYNIH